MVQSMELKILHDNLIINSNLLKFYGLGATSFMTDGEKHF